MTLKSSQIFIIYPHKNHHAYRRSPLFDQGAQGLLRQLGHEYHAVSGRQQCPLGLRPTQPGAHVQWPWQIGRDLEKKKRRIKKPQNIINETEWTGFGSCWDIESFNHSRSPKFIHLWTYDLSHGISAFHSNLTSRRCPHFVNCVSQWARDDVCGRLWPVKSFGMGS